MLHQLGRARSQAASLRKLRALVDALLAAMSADFDAVYSKVGHPSVPPCFATYNLMRLGSIGGWWFEVQQP